MNLNELNKPTEAVGAAMLRAVTGEWTRIVLDTVALGNLIQIELAITRPDGSETYDFLMEDDCLDAVEDLHSAMYQAGTGTWYSAQFTLNSALELEAAYNYDEDPSPDTSNEDLFLSDQKRFPRDNEHLPAWHPAKK